VIIYPLMTDGCKRGCCSIEPEGHGMDTRGTVAQLGKRDADDGWMQEGRLLNWARGMRDDGWMQEGRLLDWARGMRMTDGCKRDGCSIGQEGCG
jgi:hypothetical protein